MFIVEYRLTGHINLPKLFVKLNYQLSVLM